MSTTFLAFTNKTDADNAQGKIWCNFLLSSASNTEKLIGDGAGNDYYLSDIEGMTDSELCLLDLYGKKQSAIQDTSGLTKRWAIPMQCYNDPSQWVFIKPDNSLMTGVTGYTEVPEDPNWWPPVE